MLDGPFRVFGIFVPGCGYIPNFFLAEIFVMRRLWSSEAGAIVSAEIMLVATILVLGVIVGLKSVRDSVVTELADVAQVWANVDQSYSFSATSGHHGFTAGGFFSDLPDFCDTSSNGQQVCEQQSKCVAICAASLHPTGANADGH